MELPVKPENAKKVINLLYDEPVLTRNKMSEITGIKLTTINEIVNIVFFIINPPFQQITIDLSNYKIVIYLLTFLINRK